VKKVTGKYVQAELGGSFLLNAGICGFLKFLKYNHAEEGTDYEVDGQCIRVNEKFLKEKNIGLMYINTMAEAFEEETKYHRLLCSVKEKKNISLEELDDKQKKAVQDAYNNFADMLLKSSYKNAYEMMRGQELEAGFDLEYMKTLKKSKDLKDKQKYANEIIEVIDQEKVKNILIYTELLYGIFKLFFNENSMSKKILCLCDAKKRYEDTYYANFIEPLLGEMDVADKKKTTRCIECFGMAYNKKAFTFMVDSTDDVNRKKSAYWNYKPDAYVCPVCAFMYSFVPLGFVYMGGDAIFINANVSVESLFRTMEEYRRKKEEAEQEEKGNKGKDTVKKRLFRTLISEKIGALYEQKSNIQVIMRSEKTSHFRFDVIDKNLVQKLNDGKKYLMHLEKKYLKIETKDGKIKWISVYDMAFDCITGHRSFYGMIDTLIKRELDLERNFNYIMNIIYLQNIFYGGVEMEVLNKKVDAAFMAGKALRHSILGSDANGMAAEDDNRLRGIVYRLVNLASVGDCPQYLDSVIRMYAGYNLTIPAVFKDCYKSEEMFKAIAHGFILGLKYVKADVVKEEKKDE